MAGYSNELYNVLSGNTGANNMIGRQAGLNNVGGGLNNVGGGGINPLNDVVNFIGKKARSAENAIGTSLAAPISLVRDIGENAATMTNRNMWKRSLDSIYNKYGFKNRQDFDDQLYAAEDAGNQAEVDRLLNIEGLNEELKAQADANAKQATDKANAYNDWRTNSYIGQKINQDRGKFLGSSMNTLSTGLDIVSMMAGIPNGAAVNGLQGAWEGVADYLEENGGFKSENPLDWFDPEKTDVDWEQLGKSAAAGLASGMATGAFNTALDKRGIRNFFGDNKFTRKLAQNNLGKATLGIGNGVIRGGISGAIGGATGAGTASALNGDSFEQGLANMGQGALRGAAGGAAIGGTMSGVNTAGNALLGRYAPGFAESLANASGANEDKGVKSAWDSWKASGDNFTDRLYNTLDSGESGVGRWLNGEPSAVLQEAGNLGNRIQDVSGETPQRFVGVNPLGQRSEYTLDEMRNLIDEYRNYQSPRTLSGNSSSEASEVLGPAGDKLVTIYNTMHGGNTDPVYNRADGQDFLRWIDEIGGNTGGRTQNVSGSTNPLDRWERLDTAEANAKPVGHHNVNPDEFRVPQGNTEDNITYDGEVNGRTANGGWNNNGDRDALYRITKDDYNNELQQIALGRAMQYRTTPTEAEVVAEFKSRHPNYEIVDTVRGRTGRMDDGTWVNTGNRDDVLRLTQDDYNKQLEQIALGKAMQYPNQTITEADVIAEFRRRNPYYEIIDNPAPKATGEERTLGNLLKKAGKRVAEDLNNTNLGNRIKDVSDDENGGKMPNMDIQELSGVSKYSPFKEGNIGETPFRANFDRNIQSLSGVMDEPINNVTLYKPGGWDEVDAQWQNGKWLGGKTTPENEQRLKQILDYYSVDNQVARKINTDETFKRIKERPNSLFNSEVAKEIGAVITDNDLNMYQRALNGETLTRQEIQNSPVVKKFKEYVQNHGNDAIITKAQEKGEAIIDANTMAKLDDVANEYMRTDQSLQNAKNEGKAVIVLGMPASGKSSNAVDPYVEQGYFNLDNDNIKKLFPEYNNGLGAGNVHEASSYISNKMVLPKITRDKTNVVIPVIGKTLTSLENYATILKNAGYNDIHLVNVDLPIEKTATRNFTRMLETSRNVDMDYVFDVVGDKPMNNYNVIKERIQNGTEPNFTSFESISTDVPFGQPARVLENSRGVQLSGEDNSGRAAIAGGNGGDLGGETSRAQSGRELGTVGADVQRLTPETEVYDALTRGEPEFDRATYDRVVDAMAETAVNNVLDPVDWDNARFEASRALAGARTLDDLRNALANDGISLEDVYRIVPENNATNVDPELVAMSTMLRDYTDMGNRYISDEHKMLSDIADALYNAGVGPEMLLPDAKAVYDKYGPEYFNNILKRMGEIDDSTYREPTKDLKKFNEGWDQLESDYEARIKGAQSQPEPEKPRTLTDLAKKAGKRIAKDLNNTNLGLRVKDVSPEETQTYNQFKNMAEVNDRRRKAYELLAQQYGTLSRRVTQATDPVETVGKMYEMGFDKPAEVEKAVNYITGANGKANILNRKVIATAGDVDTMNGVNGEPFDDFITNLVELEGIADGVHDKAVIRQVNAVMKSLDSRRNGSLTGKDNAQDVFDVVQRLEDYARQDMGQSGTNYSTTTPEKRAQARVLRDVANVLLDRIYDNAADIKTVITPEVIAEMKAQFPGNERWAKWVDENIANAKSGRDLRAAQRPAVNMSKILTERSKNANTYGSNTGNLANLAKTVLTSNKLGLAMKGGELLANSDAGLRMRANRLLKKADRVANSETPKVEAPVENTAEPRVEAPATAETETVTGEVLPAYEAPNTSSVPYRAIGRFEGQQAASGPNNIFPQATGNTSGGNVFGNNSFNTGELDLYNLVNGTNNNATTQRQNNTGTTTSSLPKTGDYWTDLIGAAMMSAVDAGNVEAFGPLFEAYQERMSKTSSSSNLNNAQQTQMAKLDAADNAIDELESLFEGAGGAKGPVLGWLQSVGGDWGLDSGARTYNQLSEGLVNQIAQAIGKTDSLNTEGEVRRALQLIPQLTDDAATARNKLETLRRMLATTKDSYRSAYGITS